MLNENGRPTSLSTYEWVDAPLYCVLTRIRLRQFRYLPMMAWAYVEVRRQARQISQLKRCAFLVENPRTFFILSIWEDEQGFLDFGTLVTSHLQAAHWAFIAMARRGGHPEIWSTQWKIAAVSHNLNWGDPRTWLKLVGLADNAPWTKPEGRQAG